jgi:hypothetical protein
MEEKETDLRDERWEMRGREHGEEDSFDSESMEHGEEDNAQNFWEMRGREKGEESAEKVRIVI